MRVVRMFAGGLTCVTLAGLPATSVKAADLYFNPPEALCAVSGLNGKAEAAGGYIDDRGLDGGRGHVLGSFSAPIGCEFGVQIDAGIGDLDGKTAGGIAGHLFTRDPSSHLVGLYAQWGAVGSNDVYRIGVEGEKYLDNVSLEGLLGYEDTDGAKDDIFAALDVAYYANDNLRLSVGYHRFFKTDAAAFGVEWQTDLLGHGTPVSLFANAAVGSKSYETIFGGIRFYFGGPDKSLIRRHREDDPSTKGIFNLLSSNPSNNNNNVVAPVTKASPPPPTPPPPPGPT